MYEIKGSVKIEKTTTRVYHSPASIMTLLGETAADNKYPWGLNACFNSITRLENAFLSESGPWLQLS